MAISGRVPLLVLIGLPLVILWPTPLTVLGWLTLVIIACGADLLLAVPPQALRITREMPGSVRLTESVESRLTVTNSSTRSAQLQVRDAWPPSANSPGQRPRLQLGSGESLRQATTLQPTRRGDLPAGEVTVRSFGPLALAARQRSFKVPGLLRVLPEFRSRKHLPYRLARLRELDGQASVQVRGQGTEFDSLREYALGDDVRSIDWRASARSSKTMIRTWRPERDRHILIMLDTSRWAAGRIGGVDGSADQTRLDAGIETCLLMAALSAASGDRVSLLVADDAVRQRLAGTSTRSVLASFANQLSLAQPRLTETDWSLVAGQIDQLCRQRSLVILITGLDPAIYADGMGPVLPTLAKEHQVLIAHVTDPAQGNRSHEIGSATQAYEVGAQDRLWLATEALAQRVSRLGVEIVKADPERLAPAVCDAYLALKAAGRL